jgi:ribosomal protein S18 acetylase RimI-like enzyme
LPSDRAQLIDILSQGAGFRSAEIECAIELLDAALAPADPGGSGDAGGPSDHREDDGYEARVAVSDADGTAERVLGYACFGATPMTEATFDLYWLVVAAETRGQGIGRALLAGVEAELKQRGGRILRVETSSLEGQGGARRFYEKAAFRLAGAIPDFYRQGDDLLVFAKVL